MCSGALGDRSKWRRKAEAFSGRSIDWNPRRTLLKAHTVGLPELNKPSGSTGRAARASQPQASQSRPPPTPMWPRSGLPSSPSPSSPPDLLFTFLFQILGPSGCCQRPKRIKITDVSQCRQTSRLGKVHPVTTEADPSPPCPPPWCIHSPGWHFKGKGEIRKTQISPALDFRKMDPSTSFGWERVARAANGCSHTQLGLVGAFPRPSPPRQYFINWARSFEDKAWEVRAPTLSGFELKKPLNQAQKRTRRQRTQARTRTGAPSEQNESLSAGVVSPSALKTGPAATSLVTWAPRTVYSWHRRVALFRQQLLASNPEPTLFGQR